MKNLLILFIKYPEPEQVKTRLGRQIGYVNSARLYEQMVKQQLSDLICNAYDLACYVDDGHEIDQYMAKFGPALSFFYQHGKDLGERMAEAIVESFQRGYARVILMGSDIPLLDAPGVRLFFDHLRTAQMVIGPAMDGGYYMIGFQRNVSVWPIFQNIAWSTTNVFKNTLANAADLKVEIEKLWFDMDTLEDLKLYQRLIKIGKTFSEIDLNHFFSFS